MDQTSSSQAKPAVLIVELNEFNADLLQHATRQHPLPALSKVLSFQQSYYRTNDRYNSGFLEPWVQWVSIHTGMPASSHQIKHLGDVPDLQFTQCWETLGKHQITSGVWGVMNGSRQQVEQARFFLPDPWTFSEQAFPNELNHLLDLPRYVAKNYQELKKTTLLKKGWGLLKFLLTSKAAGPILKATLDLLKNLRKYGSKHFVYICYFDFISTLLFIQYKKKYQPQCNIIFLNSLAHLQHHYWTQGEETVTPEILFGLKNIDRILALLLKHFPEDAFIMHNGLSQMNTNHEKPWVLYRQKDPLKFLKTLNIPALRVEQHMTHDGHVFFANKQDCETTYELLKNATINNKKLFHVEKNAYDPCKLFYQLKFTDELKATYTEFCFNDQNYSFFEHFDRIVVRTGRHIPIGNIYSNQIAFPNHIYNHEFNHYVFNYFLPEVFPLSEFDQAYFATSPDELVESELA